MYTFTSENFTLTVKGESKKKGSNVLRLHITDKFHSPRHRFERKAFGMFSRQLEKYLAKRPHLEFDHPKNLARKLVYFPPTVRAWTAYMPGAFATYPVHNPDTKHIKTGKKIDYMTRNLFRHSIDAIGLRSRAYAMAWQLQQLFGEEKDVRWLSIASGTGQPTFDAAKLFTHRPKFYLTDVDHDAMKFAHTLAKTYDIPKSHLAISELDATSEPAMKDLLTSFKPTIIDMMGLMEYLNDTQAVALMKTIAKNAPKGSEFVFTSMLPSHPELNLHKRGLGWPGVIVRSDTETYSLLEKAGIARKNITELLPDDNVYAIFCIKIA